MDSSNIKLGQICWTDLTVDNADELKEFYKKHTRMDRICGKYER